MHTKLMTEHELSEFLTESRQARRDGLLKEWQIEALDRLGISWVDFNSSPNDYRRAVADRFEELGIDNGSTHVDRNRGLVAHLQAQKWEPFEIADAAVAGNLN
ncbi:hypothetical protein E3O11_16295 [Cryobacterium levicorallinum]|uniref:Uncharacterized protein n=1 Tax=Cryobacterium levicorallinum TaxID=995038 RepID=A0A1I3DAR8_9MICO|nr:hypothetical protein [Cryobacterium levicorallinum]TFB81835.1 hypothetical protein E3O11_16295 [Cryobacterium levicorallinum]GEP28240.1 hypothetical protein CLE01_28380 [Cryobacterium levicorallinum]SFH83648.1 hypothetical protein SAMN05216274_11720 [Cryobacterium levicorallinum]